MPISVNIAKRKSVRAYRDQPVSDDDLAAIVDAGRWAPNAGPFRISVVRNAGLRQRINDRAHAAMACSGNDFLQQRAALPGYRPLYGAPVLILLSGPVDDLHGAFNTGLAAENMLLEAAGRGLGSCFIISPTLALNGPDNRELARAAGIPEDYVLQCAVITGYAAAADPFSSGGRIRKGKVHFVD